ncbi:MAG: serine hydrolase domain-containing protein, partial [Acidimicrobiales bacterium]
LRARVMSALSPRLRVELSRATGVLPRDVRDELVEALFAMTEADYPIGFNFSVATKSATIFRAWGGFANARGPIIETESDTIYDVASLSKVVSTTTIALWLAQTRQWRLSDHLSKWLPDFPRDDLTLFQLLTHTSGLIPHRPFFHLGRDPRAIRRAVYAEATTGGPVGDVIYSDLNFMLLGWAIERCARQPLERLFGEVVAQPLAMSDTRYRPLRRQQSRIAATERNGDQRLTKELVWGEVHDGNAWALGGVAGHAGLFSTSNDLTRFVQSHLGARGHHVLSPSSISSISRTPVGTQPDVRGLGWRLDPTAWGSWPPDTLWHTGFTGTSLLVARDANLGVVLLTNAIHPTRQLDRHEHMRATLHSIVAKSLA